MTNQMRLCMKRIFYEKQQDQSTQHINKNIRTNTSFKCILICNKVSAQYSLHIASQTKVNIKHSQKHLLDFLKNKAQNSFFKFY